jgi:hypothetical protein
MEATDTEEPVSDVDKVWRGRRYTDPTAPLETIRISVWSLLQTQSINPLFICSHISGVYRPTIVFHVE